MADTDLQEIKTKLDGLLGVVQAKKEESQSSGTPWGWITAAIATILAFIGLAFAAYDAWKKGREIAKLQHEADVQAEAKVRAEIDAKLATEASTQKAQQMVAEQMAKQIESTKAQILLVEEERKAAHAKIDKVTSWVDVDKLIGK